MGEEMKIRTNRNGAWDSAVIKVPASDRIKRMVFRIATKYGNQCVNDVFLKSLSIGDSSRLKLADYIEVEQVDGSLSRFQKGVVV